MTRVILLFLQIAVVVAIAAWLADWPGEVSLDLPGYRLDLLVVSFAWPSYRIDTSVGLLVLAVAALAVAVAALYRFWRFIYRAPRDLARSVQASRRRRGYKALTQGMVAVAAGEADEAARWARKADALLDEPPLTMLLSAQAAQLTGDEAAAKRYFTAMLESEDTRFLGLRGLLTQALREGNDRDALDYARQADGLRPRTPWVLTALFDLSERCGDLETADRALVDAGRIKALPAPEAARKRAVLLLERAGKAQAADAAGALKLAREAQRLAPNLIPASLLLAELLIGAGQGRKAAKILEQAWARAPHPEFARLYLDARPSDDGIERLRRLGKLTAAQADHPETHLALAQAALAAKLWGEARRHLKEAAGPASGLGGGLEATPSEAICRLMAELEEAEHDDSDTARAWLSRAAGAPRDSAWVCGSCGAVSDAWGPRCGACQAFDGLDWRKPPHVVGPALAVTPQLPADEPADEPSGGALVPTER